MQGVSGHQAAAAAADRLGDGSTGEHDHTEICNKFQLQITRSQLALCLQPAEHSDISETMRKQCSELSSGNWLYVLCVSGEHHHPTSKGCRYVSKFACS